MSTFFPATAHTYIPSPRRLRHRLAPKHHRASAGVPDSGRHPSVAGDYVVRKVALFPDPRPQQGEPFLPARRGGQLRRRLPRHTGNNLFYCTPRLVVFVRFCVVSFSCASRLGRVVVRFVSFLFTCCASRSGRLLFWFLGPGIYCYCMYPTCIPRK